MKILIYNPRLSYFTGGGEIYPLQTAKFFAQLGHDVTVLTAKANFITFSDYFGNFIKNNPKVKIEYLELDNNFQDIYNEPAGINWTRWDRESLWVSRLAYEYLTKNHFDIVTIHNVIDSLAVPFTQKHVLHLHGTPFEINYICKLILEKQNNLIAVSQNVASKWIELGAKPNIPISTNAINEEVFFPIDNIKKDNDLLFVGRLIPIKGVQYILEALKILKDEKNFKPKLTIIGTGPYKEDLESLCLTLDIKDQVSFRGLVSNEELISSYQRSQLAVLPSYNKEGIMSTLLEAAACKLPAITTKGTSMEEFAKQDVNAILVKPENSRDLSEKIYDMLTDSNKRTQIANNAYNAVLKDYTWLAKAKELINIYQVFVDE